MRRSLPSCQKRVTLVTKSSRVLQPNAEPRSVIRPEREKGKRISVNIGGKTFQTYVNTLTSKEGSIFRLDGISNLYDAIRNEYFFERDSKSFEAILVYMQCGILEKPENVPYKIFIEELQFFGFHDVALKLYKENCLAFLQKSRHIKNNTSIRNYIWNVFEYPRMNNMSKLLTLFQSFIIVLTTVLLTASTIPAVRASSYINIVYDLELLCVGWYTLETCVRFLTCREKKTFMKNPLNITDILSFLLVYILKFIKRNELNFLPSLLRLLRITRLIQAFGSDTFLRIFNTTMMTLVSSVKEFTTFLSLLVFMLMLFSCLLYYVENGETYYNQDLSSVPRSVWFCVVTITSVGYGDIVPTSVGGRMVTISMFGATILILSLPVPIIINNFMRTHEMLKTDRTVEDFVFNAEKSTEVLKTLSSLRQKRKTTFLNDTNDEEREYKGATFQGQIPKIILVNNSEEEEEESEVMECETDEKRECEGDSLLPQIDGTTFLKDRKDEEKEIEENSISSQTEETTFIDYTSKKKINDEDYKCGTWC